MNRNLVQDEENWDDDFEFGGQSATNSPVQSIRRRSIPSPPHSPPRAHKRTKSRGNGLNNLSLTASTRTTRWSADTGGLDDENWDEDEPTIPPVVPSWSVISNPLPSSTLAPLLPPPPQSIDSKQRRPMRAPRLSNNPNVNPGQEQGVNRRLVDEFGLLTTGQDKTISIGPPAQQQPHAPHSRDSTSSQHRRTPSVPLASSTSPNSPPSTNAWNSNELELASRPFPLPSASPPISTFSLPLSHTSSNPKSHSSQMHLASGSRLLGKDKYFAKDQSERRRLRKKSRPGVVNEDDFLELEEGAVPRAPGVAYAGRGYLPNLSGSRSSIDDAASVDSRIPADTLHNPPSSDIRPSAGGLLSTAALLALEGRDSAAESSTGSANVEKPAGVGPPMVGRSAFLTRIGSLKRWAGAGVGRKRGQERERDPSNFGGGANTLVDSLGPGVSGSSSPPAESSPLRKASRERFSKLSGFLPLGLHHSPSSQQQHSPLPTTQSLTNSASSATRNRSLSAAPGGPNFTPPVSHPDSSSGVSKSAGARLTSYIHQAGSPPLLPSRVPPSPTSSRFPALKEKRASVLPTVQSGQALNTLLGEEIDRSDTPRARVPELLTKRLMTSATSESISSPSTPKANPKRRFGPLSSSKSGSRNEGAPSGGAPVVTQPTKLQLQTTLLNPSGSKGGRSGIGSRRGTPNTSPATEQSPHNTPWSASGATSPASTNPNSRRSSAVFPGVVAIPIAGSGSYRYAPKRESVNSPLSSSPPFTFSIPSSESSYVPASSTSTNPSTSSGANTSNTSFSRNSVDEPRVSPTRDQIPHSKPFVPPIELRSPSPINVTNILRRDVDLTSGDGSNQTTPVQRRGDLPGSPSPGARKAASGHRNRSSLTELGLGITPAGVTGEKKDKDKDAIPSSFKWKDGELTEDGVVDREHMVQNNLGTMRTAKQASYRRLASSSATTIKQHQNQELTVADIALAPTKQLGDIPMAPSQPPAVDSQSVNRGFVVGKGPSPEEVSESSVGSLVAGRSEISSGAGSKGGRGELKIPARITQQQHALKRDLNAVREFASCVGDLKRLQDVYRQRLGDLRLAIQEKAHSSRLSRPAVAEVRNNKRPSHAPRRSGDFRIPRWGRSSPGPVFATAPTSPERTEGQYTHILTSFQTLDATFGIWWECADLLVELSATGKEDGVATTNHSVVSSAAPSAANSPDRMKYHSPLPVTATSPALFDDGPSEESSRAMRERAVTLVGLEKPALGNGEASASRASTTGRHDLNPRQLALLKEMLNLQDPSTFPFPQSPPEFPSNAAEPRYNHSHSKSAITLLSVEESGQSRSQSPLPPENADQEETPIREKKPKRLSRRGILGVRDLLLSIKRSRDKEVALRQQFKEKETPSPLPKLPPLPRLHSSSDDLVPTCGTPHRRRKKISTDPVVQDTVSPKPILKHDAPRTDPGKWGKPNTIASGPDRLSPRRPSLSALFRLGHSPRANGGRNLSKSRGGEHHAEDAGGVSISPAVAARDVVDEDGEEWDRMELEQLERNIPSVANGYQDDAASRASRSLGLQSGVLVTAGLSMGLVSGGALKRRKRESAPPPKTAQTDMSTSSLSLGMASNASKDDTLDATTKSPSNKLRRKLSDSKVKSRGGSRQLSPLAQVVSPHAIGYAQPRTPRSLSRDLSAVSASSVNLPQSSQSAILQSPTTQEQLALTPQNLVPLLKYAKEVRTRLKECLEELAGIENEFLRMDPRPRNPRQELEVNTKDTVADAIAILVGKGYDPDSSRDSVDMDAMGGLGQSI